MKKVLCAVASVVLVASVLAGCSGNAKPSTASSSSPSSAAQTVTMRVAYMPNMSSVSAIVAAENMGYFKEQGIQVQTVKFSKGTDEIAAMGSGNIDVSEIGTGATVLCAKGQAKIVAYDCSSINDEVIANKAKGISKIADLRGKTIAATLGTSSEQILQLSLESVGMTEKDVNIVQMDASAAATAMISGKVDAVATWSPSTITIMEKMGSNAVMLANDETFSNKTTSPSSFITSNSYYVSHKDALVRFTRAIMEAQDYRVGHLKQVADWVAELIQQNKTDIEKTTDDSEWPTSKDIYNQAKDGSLKKMYTIQMNNFVTSGSLDKAVDVDTYFSPDIMIQAYEANQK